MVYSDEAVFFLHSHSKKKNLAYQNKTIINFILYFFLDINQNMWLK